MKTFNMNTGHGYESHLFSDNQPHIRVEADGGTMSIVFCSLTNSQKVLKLQMLADALDRNNYSKWELHIPYLMGARFDRIMQPGDSFDLKVIANIINRLEFNRVYLYDPHSDVAPALIERSTVIDTRKLVKMYDKENAVLIIPDAGAARKANMYAEWNPNLKYSIQCIKRRDENGAPMVKVLNPEMALGSDCVIIDDICDGGRTFIEIAKQLVNPKSVTLIVTHGIFSQAITPLTGYFDHIITTDSYCKIINHTKVTQVSWIDMIHT